VARKHPAEHIPISSDRPDTIRCIVASLVVDGESGDSLVDDDEPIQPLQSAQVDDYTDPNWEPEPIDAGPGSVFGPPH
jgi:anaphase-promoting complex subunit 2